MRLLIVEDDAELRAALDEGLSKNHTVVTVATALAALAARPEWFDVIITDHRMPAMSGVELHRVLRERGVAVPMVLMSSDCEVGKRTTFTRLFAFLAKPFGFSQLNDLLERLVPTPPEAVLARVKSLQ